MTNGEALILGLTGGYGGEMARELAARGWRLRALVRDLERGRRAAAALGLDREVELIEAATVDAEAVAGALGEARVIVHALNPPYHQWEELALPMLEATCEVASARGATVLFPGNVYAYAPGESIAEDAPSQPPTRKGEIRVTLEARLERATQEGARAIVLRGGDFFGIGHASSWMAHVLGRAVTGGALMVPSPAGVRHCWAYLPDYVRAHVDLLERADGFAPFETFHFAGHVLDGESLTRAAREALGDPARKARGVPWWLFKGMGIFQPMMREVAGMRYLWDEEVLLDESKLARTLGGLDHTPLVEALRADLAALGDRSRTDRAA